jgi:hypothetical protein
VECFHGPFPERVPRTLGPALSPLFCAHLIERFGLLSFGLKRCNASQSRAKPTGSVCFYISEDRRYRTIEYETCGVVWTAECLLLTLATSIA